MKNKLYDQKAFYSMIAQMSGFTLSQIVDAFKLNPIEIEKEIRQLISKGVIGIQKNNAVSDDLITQNYKYYVREENKNYLSGVRPDLDTFAVKFNIARMAKYLNKFNISTLLDIVKQPSEICVQMLDELISEGYLLQLDAQEYRVAENEHGVIKLPKYLAEIEDALDFPFEFGQPENENYFLARDLVSEMLTKGRKLVLSEKRYLKIPYYLELARRELGVDKLREPLKWAYIEFVHAEFLALSGQSAQALNLGIKVLEILLRENLVDYAKSLTARLSLISDIGFTENMETGSESHTATLATRASQYDTIVSLTRLLSSKTNLDELLELTVNAISEQLSFYHVGIFLLDDSSEYAILSATNSEGGKRMLKRNHRLRVGEQGIIGYVTSTGKTRIALDVGSDAVFFNNPDLPDTRSEMALPLKIGPRIVGALDVQSTQPNAFAEDEMKILEILVSQISVTIENSRLINETQNALREAEEITSQYTRESWTRFSNEKNISGIRIQNRSGSSDELLDKNDPSILRVPINLRGETIGNLNLRPSEGHHFSNDEVELVQAVADRLAIALENARLLEDAQRRARREQSIGEITARIGAASNMESILRTAVEELGRAIGSSSVAINFSESKSEKNENE